MSPQSQEKFSRQHNQTQLVPLIKTSFSIDLQRKIFTKSEARKERIRNIFLTVEDAESNLLNQLLVH